MTILVVGGGWSGLAAAVRLSQQGHPVQLLESAKQLGGRARSVNWQGLEIDNGQHLLIGAYQHTLSLLETLGAEENTLFLRRPLNLEIKDPDYPSLRLNAGKLLPWPLSLLWSLYRENSLSVTQQILRLTFQAHRFNSQQDCSVASWLSQHKQSERLTRQLWEPLCLATLNTPLSTASAAVFATVLKDTFRRRRDSDLLIPLQPLGKTLPAFAERYLKAHGSKLRLQQRVSELVIGEKRITGVVTQQGEFIQAQHVIMATPVDISRQLLTPHLQLPDMGSHPIVTVYLQYSPDTTLHSPVIGLSGALSQWVFERHDLRPGLISVVISGPGEHQLWDKRVLCEQVAQELQQNLPGIESLPTESWVIREKKATFASTVDIQRQRPNNRTEITGLWLAGDYVANRYPATLEGAVLNGEQTAMQLMEHLAVSR
jgi:squalene-associated FAD-dependent desaturase